MSDQSKYGDNFTHSVSYPGQPTLDTPNFTPYKPDMVHVRSQHTLEPPLSEVPLSELFCYLNADRDVQIADFYCLFTSIIRMVLLSKHKPTFPAHSDNRGCTVCAFKMVGKKMDGTGCVDRGRSCFIRNNQWSSEWAQLQQINTLPQSTVRGHGEATPRQSSWLKEERKPCFPLSLMNHRFS